MENDITMTVNGRAVSLRVDTRFLLADALRDLLALTGTHLGCDTSQCGACLVIIDGLPTKACTMFAVQADGADIVTVEGLAAPGEPLHPMQEAFRRHHAVQCGFCTPGMLIAGLHILERHGPALNDELVRRELAANFCRCTGYQNIVDAIVAAGAEMAVQQESAA